ncbi:hypothetical protein [Streptomyces sp. TRM64462]|uniref:hypothetical protein n=1 Tax=Streptomyces sp. TRM64462 TaxID=2741726 RepID=UPI001585E4E4|nr:hypothetical protein [Streptomyces sp. TRM64462]
MPAAQRPPRRDQGSSGTGTATGGIGVVLLVIACCALPGLIAVGALAGIGGALGNPWVIAIAAFFLATMATALVRYLRSGRGDCCPPENRTRTKDREV